MSAVVDEDEEQFGSWPAGPGRSAQFTQLVDTSHLQILHKFSTILLSSPENVEIFLRTWDDCWRCL